MSEEARGSDGSFFMPESEDCFMSDEVLQKYDDGRKRAEHKCAPSKDDKYLDGLCEWECPDCGARWETVEFEAIPWGSSDHLVIVTWRRVPRVVRRWA